MPTITRSNLLTLEAYAKLRIGSKVELKLNTGERCSGHAGTYGVKTATHPVAMKIGKPVLVRMAYGLK